MREETRDVEMRDMDSDESGWTIFV
jgi:hypothetical protein